MVQWIYYNLPNTKLWVPVCYLFYVWHKVSFSVTRSTESLSTHRAPKRLRSCHIEQKKSDRNQNNKKLINPSITSKKKLCAYIGNICQKYTLYTYIIHLHTTIIFTVSQNTLNLRNFCFHKENVLISLYNDSLYTQNLLFVIMCICYTLYGTPSHLVSCVKCLFYTCLLYTSRCV